MIAAKAPHKERASKIDVKDRSSYPPSHSNTAQAEFLREERENQNSTSKAHIDPIVFPRHSLSTPLSPFPPLSSREGSGENRGRKRRTGNSGSYRTIPQTEQAPQNTTNNCDFCDRFLFRQIINSVAVSKKPLLLLLRLSVLLPWPRREEPLNITEERESERECADRH